MPIVNVAAVRYCGMSDSEKLLDSDHESLPGPSVYSLPDGSSAHHTGNNDLVDTFSLFKTNLDEKIATLHKHLVIGNENFATKLEQEVSVKLKGEGNQIQFNFNCEIMADLVKLQKRIPDEDAACLKLVSGAILKVKKRNKLICIADKPPAGWKTVREYESDDLASDSEDEKRIRSAESRAIRSIKEKKIPHPYRTVRATVSAPPAPMPNQHNVQQNNYKQPPFRISMTSVTNATSLVTGELSAPFSVQNQLSQGHQGNRVNDKYFYTTFFR